MKALVPTQARDLTEVLAADDDTLFSAPVLARALELLADQAGTVVADVETAEGRAEITKLARAVGGAIARLDDRRRAYVAELKARPAAIDKLFREAFRKPAEALQDRIRRPLDDWQAAMREAEEETGRIIAELTAPVEVGTPAEHLRARLEWAEGLDIPDWLTETQRDAIASAMAHAIPRLQAAHAAAVKAAEQAAELERLRAVAREAELQQAREEAAAQARADAERRAAEERERQELARMDAERRAKEAESRQRKAEEAAASQAEAAAMAERERAKAAALAAEEEARRRAADREHAASIHREVLADLCALGIDEDTGRALITAIARGQIPHLHITY
jgi:flagellar biosynthesis GTPase FlhF